MRNSTLLAILINIAIVTPPFSYGQLASQDFDTVFVSKPKKSGYNYFINDHPLFSEVTFDIGRPHIHDFPGGRPAHLAENDFSLSSDDDITQLEIVKSKTFLLKGEIQCTAIDKNWIVYLYVEGFKKVVRTENEKTDGGVAWSKDKSYVLRWDRAPIGMISELGDTTARFYISMDPHKDEYFNNAISTITKTGTSEDLSDNKGYSYKNAKFTCDFGIWGSSKKQQLVILFNSVVPEAYIFLDSVWTGTFRSDRDFVSGIGKNDRIQPYIILDKNVSDSVKNDIIRLAFLSRYLKSMVSKSEYGVLI